jgi:DnaK suppressor protein
MTLEFDKSQVTRQLEDAHREIAKSLGLRDQVCIEQVADAMDQVQAAAARDLAISNLDRSMRWLREIKDALRRLDLDEYGTCANCEEGIGSKRLRAVPWAQFCLKCQEMADQIESGDRGHDAAEPFLNAA